MTSMFKYYFKIRNKHLKKYDSLILTAKQEKRPYLVFRTESICDTFFIHVSLS